MSLFLAAATCFLSIMPARAAEAITVDDLADAIQFYSEEFPDAYITTEINTVSTYSGSEISKVSATAFVEETYTVVEGETFTTSRLLSEAEVNSIGANNFQPIEEVLASASGTSSGNYRGTLTITLSGTADKVSATSSQYSFTGTASWSGYDVIYNTVNNPASGEDYFGFSWGGNFAYKNISATAKLSNGRTSEITLCNATANQALVWPFYERQVIMSGEGYIKPATMKATLYKNSLEGNGNITSVVLKYIHTYTTTAGSISVSAGSGGASAGFSLSGVDKQWSIVCMLGEMYY